MAVTRERRGGEPRPVGAAALGARFAELAAGEPRDLTDDTAEAATAEVRARQARVQAGVWESTLAMWPDDDFAAAQLDGLAPDQQGAAVLRWLQDRSARLLILAGRTGAGKSHTAFAIGNHYAAMGRPVRAFKHARYLDGLMPDGADSVERHAESRARMKRRAMDAELLLLDEFGAGMPLMFRSSSATPFAQRETGDLLSMRLRAAGRRTVVTTNLQWQDLQLLFEDRVLSRLAKDATVLLFTGPDRRVQRGGRVPQSWEDFT